MGELLEREELRNIINARGCYISVCKTLNMAGIIGNRPDLIEFAEMFDLSQDYDNSSETHVLLKDYGNYLATYNMSTGSRDTIQKASIIMHQCKVSVLGKMHKGEEIIQMLDNLNNGDKQATPTIIKIIHEEIDKDSYFIVLEYIPVGTRHLETDTQVPQSKKLQRACAIVSRKELEHYQDKYKDIVVSRVGI